MLGAKRIMTTALVATLLIPSTAAATPPLTHARKWERAAARAGHGMGLAVVPALSPAALPAPLPSSPVTGTLDPTRKPDALYSVPMRAGDRLSVAVTGVAGADIDLYLTWPGAPSLTGPYAASAITTAFPERLVFDAAVTGTYTLDAFCAGGATPFTLAWSVTRAASTPAVTRLWGADRYATAIAISAATFPTASSQDAVLAAGSKYPDALSASSLAGSLGCPLLITATGALSPGVLAEIKRVGARRVHVVGGPASVSEAVLAQLRASGRTVTRYWGPDRYSTAAIVAAAVRQLNPHMDGRAFLASGQVYPDALSASPYAYNMGYPILLTRKYSLDPNAAAALRSAGVRTVYISGGPGTIVPAVEDQLRASGYTVVRLWGIDRYATSVACARYAVAQHWGDPSVLTIASGQVFPDALTGSAATGDRGGVLVLTPKLAMGADLAGFVRQWGGLRLVDSVFVYGGPGTITSSTYASIAAAVR